MADEEERPTVQLFVYQGAIDAPACTPLPTPRPMRIRGYRLAFAEGNEYVGPVFTLVPIRGDGTVPGVVYELDAICVDVLSELYGAAGYQLGQVHLEAITRGRGGTTVPAMAFMLSRDDAQAAVTPRATDLTTLRAAWQGWGLDTAAIDHAFGNP